jgi:hypothetical protein
MVVLPAPRQSATDPQPSPAFSLLDKVISLMSAVTMLSTVPQVVQVWLGRTPQPACFLSADPLCIVI